MFELRLAQFLPQTRVEGPGLRAAIWVQGCPIHCPGCAVPEYWDFHDGTSIRVEDLANKILSIPNLEGVTFAGGEPFTQATPLALLGRMVQAKGLSVITFSGYTIDELRARHDEGTRALLSVTDLLIAGPFRQEEADGSLYLAGSRNQQFHYLTSRYRSQQGKLEHTKNRIELHILKNGKVLLNGMMIGQKMRHILDDKQN